MTQSPSPAASRESLSSVGSLRDLNGALHQLEPLLHSAVSRADASAHDPTDALRGLIVTPDEMERHLSQPGLAGLWSGTEDHFDVLPAFSLEDPSSPLAHIVNALHLPLIDQYILLIALAPELDRRYERIYAYLQDDVSLRRPTVNLAMNILGRTPEERLGVWSRLMPESPLRWHGLIDLVADSARPNSASLLHALRVDGRTLAFLLRSDFPDERLRRIVTPVHDVQSPPDLPLEAIQQAFSESPLIFFRGLPELGQLEVASSLCQSNDLNLLRVDSSALSAVEMSPDAVARITIREGILHGAALLIDHWDVLLELERRPLLTALWERIARYPLPVFICGERDWEPPEPLDGRRMLRLGLELPAFGYRRALWADAAYSIHANLSDSDIDGLASKFRFGAARIARAAQTAADIAASKSKAPDVHDLYAGAQAHASLSLGHLASRITPRAGWDELVLPPDPLTQLRELCDRLRFSFIVREQWGFGARTARGISALFAGESGTGKTLAAEVVAQELGLVLYKIDLSAVVSKYIGETEKNLNVIFNEAQSGNAILFFDEADALFGKRSEVKDARDRYANIEVAYLLQRVEQYDGVVILATNFRQNIDDAFTRRLDFMVDFPFPTPEYRERIWAAHFPPGAPLGKDVDLVQIANEFRLAGGSIRNAAIASAYLAAADSRIITGTHIRSAVRREHQKMGRLLDG